MYDDRMMGSDHSCKLRQSKRLVLVEGTSLIVLLSSLGQKFLQRKLFKQFKLQFKQPGSKRVMAAPALPELLRVGKLCIKDKLVCVKVNMTY